MSLRYALLALLTVEPMTGYDLSKRFESSVAYVLHAPDLQIYPELRRMERDPESKATGTVKDRSSPSRLGPGEVAANEAGLAEGALPQWGRAASGSARRKNQSARVGLFKEEAIED